MRLRHCLISVSFAALSSALAPQPVAALEWIVVPYGVSQASGAMRAADRLVRALADRRLIVASQHELKDLFLARSRAHRAPDSQLAKLVADARKQALDDAAYGRREPARRAAEQAMQVAESTPEVLRDSDVARHVLDACLAVVRVDLQERDRTRAVQDAQRCRRLVPDLAPRESTHSAEVVGVLAEAENELRRAGAGALNVMSGASESCGVFLQGRRLGSTPYRHEHAPLGQTRVFLECGSQQSRVHTLRLDEREQTLTIDQSSDARVADSEVIALVYVSDQELDDHLAGDVQRVGDTTGARAVVLVRELPNGRVEAVRYDVTRKQPVAIVQLEAAQLLGGAPAPAQRAADILATQRLDAPLPRAFHARPAVPGARHAVSAAGEPEISTQAPSPQTSHADSGSSRPRVWSWSLGAATLAAGAAVLGLGLAVKDKVSDHNACVSDSDDPVCDRLTEDGDRLALATNVMAGVTGALAAATLTAFFVEGRRKRGHRQTTWGVGPTGISVRGSF